MPNLAEKEEDSLAMCRTNRISYASIVVTSRRRTHRKYWDASANKIPLGGEGEIPLGWPHFQDSFIIEDDDEGFRDTCT